MSEEYDCQPSDQKSELYEAGQGQQLDLLVEGAQRFPGVWDAATAANSVLRICEPTGRQGANAGAGAVLVMPNCRGLPRTDAS